MQTISIIRKMYRWSCVNSTTLMIVHIANTIVVEATIPIVGFNIIILSPKSIPINTLTPKNMPMIKMFPCNKLELYKVMK